MSCQYCTPRVDPDTGEDMEFCMGYHDVIRMGDNTTEARLHLVRDKDDGSWLLVILLADDWLSRYIHSLGEPAKRAGMICTTIEAPPFCPFCGRKLYGSVPEN